MQVEGGVHARLPNGVKMHHVAMIGQQIVIGARLECVHPVRVVAADLEIERVAGELGGKAERMVDVRCIGQSLPHSTICSRRRPAAG